MLLLVTSASGTNGNGFGALLAFELNGTFSGTFIEDDRIADPRGLAVDPKENLLFLNSGADRVLAISSDGRVARDTGWIEGLDPGGGNFGPDGRCYVGSRNRRTIVGLSTSLDGAPEQVLPPYVVPFPRGFAFGHDGRLFLASGIGPDGQGDNAIVAFSRGTPSQFSRLVADPELSPLDLAVAPNGNIVVSSEQPFGVPNAVTSVREYSSANGQLIRVFSADGSSEFADLPPKARQIMVASVMKAHQLLIDNLAAARGSRDDNDSLAGLIITFFSGICLEQNLGPDRARITKKIDAFMRLIQAI